jgi:hypothetical protein
MASAVALGGCAAQMQTTADQEVVKDLVCAEEGPAARKFWPLSSV